MTEQVPKRLDTEALHHLPANIQRPAYDRAATRIGIGVIAFIVSSLVAIDVAQRIDGPDCAAAAAAAPVLATSGSSQLPVTAYS